MRNRKKIIIGAVGMAIALVMALPVLMLQRDTDVKKIREEDANDKSGRVLTYGQMESIATNEYYGHSVDVYENKLDEYVAYSLNYNVKLLGENGDKLSKQNATNGCITTALLFGYPTFSPEEMGVESEEEAILATQFAVWRLAQAEGIDEAKAIEYVFDMDNLMPKVGYEQSLERIKCTAQGLVDIALKAPYYATPTLAIDDKSSKIRLLGEQMIVGPYAIKAGGYTISDVSVSLTDVPESAVTCDVDGIVKTEFDKDEDIYILLDSNVGEVSFTLRVDTEGSHAVGTVYGTGQTDDNKQNVCILERFPDEIDAVMDIHLPEISINESDIQGYLKVISVDESKEKRLADITYEILNEDGIVLETLVSDENGEIISQKLPKGKYYFREISGPNDIHIDSTKYEFEIFDDDVVEVYTLLHYYARAKMCIKFTDEDGMPVIGMEVQILDGNYNVVDTIYSDDNGYAESKYLLIGDYYYRQIAGPDHIIIDSTEYSFALTKSLQLLMIEDECGIAR